MTQSVSRGLALLAMALVITVGGCVLQQDKATAQGVAFSAIYGNTQCSIKEKRLQLLTTPDEAMHIFTQPAELKTRIGAAPVSALYPNELNDRLSQVDFSTHQVVLVAWGPQPNPGYSPISTSTNAQILNGVLELPLKMKEPQKGAMHPQVVVYPCQLFSIKTQQIVSRIELSEVVAQN